MPDRKALDAALKRGAVLFGKDLRGEDPAVTAAFQRALELGASSTEPADRLALLEIAVEAAVRLHDPRKVVEATRRIGTDFEGSAQERCLEALERVLDEAGRGADELRPTTVELLRLSDEAVLEGELDLAKKALRAAGRGEKRLKDRTLATARERRESDLTALKGLEQGARRAQVRLAQEPEDPGACLDAGLADCVLRDDWEAGLELLERGVPGTIPELARDDRLEPAAVKERMALGRRWLEQGRLAKTRLERHRFEQRARTWLEQALEGASGLDRAELETTLASLQSSFVGAGLRDDAYENWLVGREAEPWALPARDPAAPRRPRPGHRRPAGAPWGDLPSLGPRLP